MCTFCAYYCCKACTKKQKPFPMASVDPVTKLKSERGTICKLCDRKFFVHKKLQQKLTEIEGYQTSIVRNQTTGKRLHDEISQAKTQHLTAMHNLESETVKATERNRYYKAVCYYLQQRLSKV